MIDWITIDYDDNTPLPNKEVVAMSPDGTGYITTWRSGYNIFCGQGKGEDSSGWKWVYLQ